jgi:hypothetical protein
VKGDKMVPPKNTKKMEYSQCIGIDTSKAWLDFAIYQNQKSKYLKRVDNQIETLQPYLEELQQAYDLIVFGNDRHLYST